MVASTSWGVAVTQPAYVDTVRRRLSDMDVDCFIPRVEKLTFVNGRRLREHRPLLGGYVLLAITSRWREVARLREVYGMLMNELGFPAQVLAKELEVLRGLCPNGIYAGRASESDGFNYGAKVTMKKGPFAYHVGRYDGLIGRNREVAIFTLFGREQKVKFKRGELIAA